MPATERQTNFINSLLAERQVPEGVADKARALMVHPDAQPRVEISQLIDRLMGLPKLRAVRAVAAPAGAPRRDVFAGVEDSKYAIPAAQVPASCRAVLGDNSHLFVEVKTYRGKRYLNKLTGAPGAFSRSRLAWPQVLDLLDTIRPQSLVLSQEFGRLYSCCGVCGAELTDERSRLLKLGAVCRTRFGL